MDENILWSLYPRPAPIIGAAGPGPLLVPGPKNLPLLTRLSMTRSISAKHWSGFVVSEMWLSTNLRIAKRKHLFPHAEWPSQCRTVREEQAAPTKPAAGALAILGAHRRTCCVQPIYFSTLYSRRTDGGGLGYVRRLFVGSRSIAGNE